MKCGEKVRLKGAMLFPTVLTPPTLLLLRPSSLPPPPIVAVLPTLSYAVVPIITTECKWRDNSQDLREDFEDLGAIEFTNGVTLRQLISHLRVGEGSKSDFPENRSKSSRQSWTEPRHPHARYPSNATATYLSSFVHQSVGLKAS